jgi:hypothetical protein
VRGSRDAHASSGGGREGQQGRACNGKR